MFSEESYELDRNTMKLMVDEMQDEIDDVLKSNDEKQSEIDNLQKSNDNLLIELRACKEKYGNL